MTFHENAPVKNLSSPVPCGQDVITDTAFCNKTLLNFRYHLEAQDPSKLQVPAREVPSVSSALVALIIPSCLFSH